MKLTSITVKNFRTLENITIDFDGFYTAISGQNNAGKTTLLKAIRHTFRDNNRELYFYRNRDEVSYREDRTQWAKNTDEILLDYIISVSSVEDPGLYQFIEKFNEEKLIESTVNLRVAVSHKEKEEIACICWVNAKGERGPWKMASGTVTSERQSGI